MKMLPFPNVVRNDEKLYKGDLLPYFRATFVAPNARLPYHNFRHAAHVTTACYDACRWYGTSVMAPDQMRWLLIAAMFHDYRHAGTTGDDDLNILRALRGLKQVILPEDEPDLPRIEEIIIATEFPHRELERGSTLSQQIIRDADLTQGLCDGDWMQDIVFGLSSEWGQNPLDVLKGQEVFVRKLSLQTQWAAERFGAAVPRRLEEIKQLIALLDAGERA